MDQQEQQQWTMEMLEDESDDDMIISMIFNDTDHDDDDHDVLRQPKRGGSHPGRRPNRRRDPHARHLRLVEQYFAETPVYNENDFRRRYRMSRRLFERVKAGIVEADPEYFVQRPDACGKM